jgi:TP901 family phage tail tape measure protein
VTGLVAKYKELQAAYPQIAADAFAGKLNNLTGIAGKLRLALDKVVQTERQMGSEAYKAAAAQDRLAQATDKTGKSFLIGAQGLAKYAQYYGLFLATSKTIGAISQGTRESIDFGNAIARVQTLAQDMPVSFDSWTEAALRFSGAFGVTAKDAAQSFYNVLSQTQGATKQQVEDLAATSIKLATILGTDVSSATNLITSNINALGLGFSKAEELAAKLFLTVDIGNVTLPQLEQVMGRTVVTGTRMGVSINEVVAALATLTRQGIASETANTQLYNIFNQLLKPSEALKKLYNSWGTDTGDLAIKTFGLTGVLNKLNEEGIKGGTARIAELIPELRGMQGTIGLTGDALKVMEGILANDIPKAMDKFNGAGNIVFDNTAKKAEIAKTKLDNLFNKIGTELTVAFVAVTDKLGITSTKLEEAIATATADSRQSLIGLNNQTDQSFGKLTKSVDVVKTGILNISAAIKSNLSPAIDTLDTKLKGSLNNLKAVATATNQAISDQISKSGKRISDLANAAENARNKNLDFRRKLDRDTFTSALNNQSPDQQLITIRERLSKALIRYRQLSSEASKGELTDLDVLNRALDEVFQDYSLLADKTVEYSNKIKELRGQKKLEIKEYQELQRLTSKDPRINLAQLALDINKQITLEYNKQNEARRLLEEKAAKEKRDLEEQKEALDRNYDRLLEIAKIGSDKIKDPGALLAETQNIVKTIDAISNRFLTSSNILDVTKERRGLSQIQKDIEDRIKLVALDKQVDEERQKAVNLLETETKNISALTEKEKALNSQRVAAAAQLKGASDYIFNIEKRRFGSGTGFLGLSDSELKKFNMYKEILGDLTKSINDLDKGEIDQLRSVYNQLQGLVLRGANGTALTGATQGTLDAIDKAFSSLGTLERNITSAEKLQTDIQTTSTKIDTMTGSILNLAAEAELKLPAAINAVGSAAATNVKQLTEQIQRLQQMTAAIQSSTVKQATGGRMFASGGMGTDTINAMLSPGEFVMSKRATTQFYSKLVGMNNSTRQFATGGNVTTGDFNISLNTTGNTKTDVIAIGRALQREIRRGTVRL